MEKRKDKSRVRPAKLGYRTKRPEERSSPDDQGLVPREDQIDFQETIFGLVARQEALRNGENERHGTARRRSGRRE